MTSAASHATNTSPEASLSAAYADYKEAADIGEKAALLATSSAATAHSSATITTTPSDDRGAAHQELCKPTALREPRLARSELLHTAATRMSTACAHLSADTFRHVSVFFLQVSYKISPHRQIGLMFVVFSGHTIYQ